MLSAAGELAGRLGVAGKLAKLAELADGSGRRISAAIHFAAGFQLP